MGCGTSKPKVCQNCRAPYSPVRRSYSLHGGHHHQKTEEKERDNRHMVALTSSTLGSLRLDPMIQNLFQEEKNPNPDNNPDKPFTEMDQKRSAKEEYEMGMIEAKTWSNMINERIPKVLPKTPIATPPGEPEMINAWELMEGLEDVSPLRPVHHFRSFSFEMPRNSGLSSNDDDQLPTPRVKENGNSSPKQSWLDPTDSDSNSNSNSNSNDTSVESEFDPEVLAPFRKSLEGLPPANPFNIKPPADKDEVVQVQRGTDKLIVYFTSLRGVRKTYEDCCHVRVILKGLRVKVDERDVSMHSGFKDELKEKLGEGFVGTFLPRVFLGKKCIGGAEEIRRLNEEGLLEKMVESCELVDDVCEACGDVRFLPCETCSGSCKIYYEGDYDDDEGSSNDGGCDGSENEYGFQRCPDCNENGLIRCPVCCD